MKARRLPIALLCINVYLIFVFLFGAHGVMKYHRLKAEYAENSAKMEDVKFDINMLQNKISLLNGTDVNMQFLEEKIRIEFALANEDEYIIML